MPTQRSARRLHRSRPKSPKRSRRSNVRRSPNTHPAVHLQQTIGNHATAQLLQAKLKIGQPGDRYEREADRVAEQVVGMPDRANSSGSAISHSTGRPAIQRAATMEDDKRVVQGPHEMYKGPLEEEEQFMRRQPAAEEEIKKPGEEEQMMQRAPAMEEETKKPGEEETMQRQPLEEEPKKKPEEEETATLQPKSNGAKAPSVNPAVAGNINSMRGGGSPLPGPVRAYFEPRMGYDLSDVRVHTGDKADGTARAVNARAFTVGRDVVFGAGEYSPETTQGRKLLAHELTHVAQQGKIDSQKKEIESHNFRSRVHQIAPQMISKQGLLTPAEETAAINYNNARYDERSTRIIQITTGANVDGQFGQQSAEAVAAFQDGLGLAVDGKVGVNTLNDMVLNRAAAGRHEHAIQLVVDFHNLDVTSDTLTVHFDPALAAAGATTFESGNLRVIRVGPPAFASAAALQAAIQAQLAAPAPAPAAVGPRPAHLTNAQESAAIQFNRRRFNDHRSVLAIQGLVGTGLDGIIGRDTVERIAEFQNTNGLTVDGEIGDIETLPAMVTQLIAAGQQNAAIRMIVDFYNMRDDGNLLDVRFDPAVAANASTDFRVNEPVRVLVGPSGLAQPFAGIVHTIAHEYEHVRRLKEGIASANTHEFLGEAIEILSAGMQEEALEAVAPGAPGFVAGFANDAARALANWNAMPLADRRRFRARFIAVRQRVRDRIAAGTPGQQALHAPLLANYNAVVLPPP